MTDLMRYANLPADTIVEAMPNYWADEMIGLFGTNFKDIARRERISVCELGGTLAGIKGIGGLSPGLTFKEIVQQVFGNGAQSALGELFIPPFGSRYWHFGLGIDSAEIGFPHIMCIVDRLFHHVAASGGVIVTCGTDRLADICKLVSTMLIFPPVPVIFTGSQLSAADADNDIRRNLEDAALCARKLPPGFYVVFGGKIINALDAYKYSTEMLDGFASSSGKYVGFVNAKEGILDLEPLSAEDVIMKEWLVAQEGKATFCSYEHSQQVMVIEPPLGCSTKLIREVLELPSLLGAVIKIPGLGGFDRTLREELIPVAQSKPIVLATSSPHGRTDLSVYATGEGVEEAGFISAKHMSACAGILLQRWLGLLSQTEYRGKIVFSDNPLLFLRENFHKTERIPGWAQLSKSPFNDNPFRDEMVKHGYAAADDWTLRSRGD
jgi:L-asparaginase/Glu-tRNA(Gln) amidotransferase subunit D